MSLESDGFVMGVEIRSAVHASKAHNPAQPVPVHSARAHPDHPAHLNHGFALLRGLGGLGNTQQQLRATATWIFDHEDPDPLTSLSKLIESYPINHALQVESGWLIMLSYELGHQIEPKACADDHIENAKSTRFPLVVAQRVEPGDESQIYEKQGFAIGSLRSSMGKSGYIGAIESVKDFIKDGDIYQASLAHALSGSFVGDVRNCFETLVDASDPKFGAMMQFAYQGDRIAILSISPELFLEYDPTTRMIRTQPMKGTRPIGSDINELRDSIKDRAELDMITDLMRNDLGRVCQPGTMRVVEARHIESHGSGVLQASSIIEGRLAEGMGLVEILRSTFPPGSVTGVPKVRAMQVISELEMRARESYCGSMLMIRDSGAIQGSVSIRTAQIRGESDPNSPHSVINGRFVYPVGAGIVADSDPESEWAETLTKASILRSALGIDLGS